MATLVRLATERDVPRLVASNQSVQALHQAALPDIYVDVDPSVIAARFRELLDDPGHRVWVAEVQGEFAGHLVAELREREATPYTAASRAIEVHQLGVDLPRRRRGVGAALMAQAEGWARATGCSRVTLQVMTFNAEAVGFYDRLGYAPLSERRTRLLD